MKGEHVSKSIGLCVLMLLFAGCQTASTSKLGGRDWPSMVSGVYTGVIYSSGRSCPGVTYVSRDARGALSGRYEFTEEDGTQVEGKLDTFEALARPTLRCRWTDKYGSGSLSMSFDGAVTSFDGWWNADGSRQRYPWNGSR